MDREFKLQAQPNLSGSEASFAVEMAVDEAFFNGVYAGLTFHSLLKQEQMPPPLLLLEPSLNFNPNGFPETENQDLKISKNEQQVFNVNSSISGEVSHYNFFSNIMPTVAESDVVFPQLPGLLSLELPQCKNSQLCTSSPSYSVEPAAAPCALDSERKSYHQHRFCQYRSPGAVATSSTVARQRRQRITVFHCGVPRIATVTTLNTVVERSPPCHCRNFLWNISSSISLDSPPQPSKNNILVEFPRHRRIV